MPPFHREISRERLVELLDYSPERGIFTWRQNRGKTVKAGVTAGSLRDGYVVIMLDKQSYKAHRLAFLYVTGGWPEAFVDHIDGDRTNNCWANLREATYSENSQNRGIGVNNTSGYIGVSWKKGQNRWQARIRVAGHLKHLGYFDEPKLAAAAYAAAKSQLHTFCPTVRSN